MNDKELLAAAQAAATRAYAVYSHFQVGAALLCADGTVYTGCNVENASYPLCTCAERTALCKAVSEGKSQFSAIAIAETNGTPCLPCGACRQMLAEFCDDDFRIIVAGETADAPLQVFRLGDLLPNAFRLATRF